MSENLRRTLGGGVGLGLGVLAYWLLLRLDLHILAGVGAGLALGVSAAATQRRPRWGLITALAAVAASLLVEFVFLPFAADPSLGYFLTHIDDLPRNSLVSLAVVSALGFWFGCGRTRLDSSTRV